MIYELPTIIKGLEAKTDKIPEGVKMINAPLVWKDSLMGEGRIIAVLDSGCDVNHPDLKNNIADVFNFTNDDGGDKREVRDYSGHGTHVAGIIAASQNGYGVLGVAPKSKLVILKVISKKRVGRLEHLLEGLEYAINWRSIKGVFS